MNQFRQNKRSWGGAALVVLEGLLLGSGLSGQAFAQYQQPGRSPYGLVAPFTVVVPPSATPAETAPSEVVPAGRTEADSEAASAPVKATVEPAMMERMSAPPATSITPAHANPATSEPTPSNVAVQPPAVTPAAIPLPDPITNPPSPAPEASSEPPLAYQPEPMPFWKLMNSLPAAAKSVEPPAPTVVDVAASKPVEVAAPKTVEPAPSKPVDVAPPKLIEVAAPKSVAPPVAMPSFTPPVRHLAEPPQVVDVQPVSEPKPASEPQPMEQHATPVAAKQTDSVVVPAVVKSESSPAALANEADKGPNITSKAPEQPAAMPAVAESAKVKDLGAEASAEKPAEVATTASPAAADPVSALLGTWTPMQMLLALVVAIALGTSTGVWAIILVAGRRALPKDTIELINQTLEVYCTHLTSGRASYGWAPHAGTGGPHLGTARERHARATSSDPMANDVIVQNILRENKNIRTDNEPVEAATEADAADAPATETAAAPGGQLGKVIWELKVDDLATS